MLQLVGKGPGLGFHTDDCRKTIAELEARGVKILQQPRDQRWGHHREAKARSMARRPACGKRLSGRHN